MYIYSYEIVALLFILLLMFRYLVNRSFFTYQNLSYALLVTFVAIDIILDIGSSLSIDYLIKSDQIILFYLICTLFYFFRAMTACALYIYLQINSRKIKKIDKKILISALPCFFLLFVLIANFKMPLIFYVDGTEYSYGPLRFLAYLIVGFYLVASYIHLTRYRKAFNRKQIHAINLSVIIILIVGLIQYFVPRYLIVGVATTISIYLLYFTIQNPENMIDATTGAMNYSGLVAYLDNVMIWKKNFGIITVDIHGFSRINQLFGIPAADDLLRSVYSFLNNHAGNIIFRTQGTRFVCIVQNVKSYDVILNSILNRFNRDWYIESNHIRLRASIISFPNPDEIETGKNIINYIETSLFEASRQGKKELIVLDNKNQDFISRVLTLEEFISESFKTNENLFVYVQPIFSCKENKFTRGEALIRLKHPTLGFVSPGEFIPLAEKHSLVKELDEFVIRKVFEYVSSQEYAELGFDEISINLSAIEFQDEDMYQRIIALARQYSFDPKNIFFEMTETSASYKTDILVNNMRKLIEFGFKFALDDFGSGYANLTEVLQLPFEIVKIDRTVLIGSSVVLLDMIEMFNHIDKIIVVEGVESRKQVDFLASTSTDYIQGFYYAKPIPIEDLCTFVKAKNIHL